MGAAAGNGHIEGDISMDAYDDVLPYFLYASRCTIAKTGTNPNYVYTATPNQAAVVTTGRTLSITIVRAGEAFGYTGCVVSSFTLGVDGQTLTYNVSIQGLAEATQTVPTPTWTTTGNALFGAGTWTIEIPTTTQVFDVDTFEFQVEDNAEAQNRLKSSLGAQFIKYGERAVTLSAERDFVTRTEYDQFKALTAKSVSIKASRATNNYVNIVVPNSVIDSYEVALGGQGDLVRASISYNGVYDTTTSKAYSVVVGTQENIT